MDSNISATLVIILFISTIHTIHHHVNSLLNQIFLFYVYGGGEKKGGGVIRQTYPDFNPCFEK